MFTTLSGCSIKGIGRGMSIAEGKLGGGKFSHGSTGVAVGPGIGLVVAVGVIVAVGSWVGKIGQVAGTNGMKAGVGLAGARMAGIDKVQATPADAAARTTTSATPNGAVRFEGFDVGDIKLLTKRMEERFLLERACGEIIKAV
ncbi:MAG TPA: hypothetical protein VJK02_15145 [Anaerolineales bacterium]|nr:hypothetical protein [Anaerolineales bacterium]